MKKKRILIPIGAFCACFLLLIAGAFLWSNRQALEKAQLCWGEAGSQEAVSLFERDGSWYGFLPDHAGDVILRTDAGVSLWLDGELYRGTPLEPEGEHVLAVHGFLGREIVAAPLVIMRSGNIPAVSIQLTSGSTDQLKQRKICSAYMTMTQPDGRVSAREKVEEFHIRGNYTSWLPKTSYAMKFKNAVDLLGTGTDTGYCLIANADDESRMRNKLVYDTALELGLAHSPTTQYVDLYVDGDYYGLYLLTERINVAPNRINLTDLQKKTEKVNFYSLKHYGPWSSAEEAGGRRAFDIPTDPADITGGYLLEKEIPHRLAEHSNVFITDSGVTMSVKYPAQCSAAQLNYIADLCQNIENAMLDGTYGQWIDVESWAKYYLVEEFFGQQDRASVYFYKDSDAVDGKVYAGPVWDFDLSLGLSLGQGLTGISPGTAMVSPNTFHFNLDGWFEILYQDGDFRNTVARIYEEEFKPLVERLLADGLKDLQTQIDASHAMDGVRWSYRSAYALPCGSLALCVEQLDQWICQRVECMDSVLLEGKRIIPVKLVTDPAQENGTVMLYYAEGSSVQYLPELKRGDDVGTWCDGSGRPADLSTPATEGTAFYASWKKAGTEPAEEVAASMPEETEPDEEPVPTDTADYIVLLCLGVLCLYVGAQVLVDLGQNGKKKRKNHEH